MGDVGAYVRGTGAVAPTRIAQYLPGPYRIPHFACTVNVFVSNKVPCCTYRGPGRTEGNFFRERLIDIAARDLGIDPAQMRRKNLVTPAELPFDLGDLVTYPPTGATLDSGDYAAALEEALREIGWAEKRATQGQCIDGWYHGIGFACFYEGSAGGPNEHARLRLAREGTIELFVGATSSGQGHETVFGQTCADEMQLPMNHIRVIDASTDQLVSSIGTFNSRSTMMAGNAVRVTSQTFKGRLRTLALDYLNRPNVPLEWSDGAFRTRESGVVVTLAELADFAHARGEAVDVTEAFQDKGMKPFSYGTHAAHVAVDARTGRIRLIDFIAVEDIGRVVNPLLAHGQATGAIVQGLGGTFLEHLQYDEEGQLLTASLADYLMPTATDFPNIRSKFLDLARAPGNPLGVKGGGEGGIVAVSAAVGNAVSAALSSFGVEVHDLPLTPPRVWQMIAKVRR
jgi:carbon-monoxide dehydrogenase large subunit